MQEIKYLTQEEAGRFLGCHEDPYKNAPYSLKFESSFPRFPLTSKSRFRRLRCITASIFVVPFTLPFQDSIRLFTRNDLIDIQKSCRRVRKFQPLIWCRLIKDDYEFTINHFLEVYHSTPKRREKRRVLANFVKSKKCATKSKMKKAVKLLLEQRNLANRNVTDYLIATFAYEIKEDLHKHISQLDESDFSALDLKIRLLGVRGTKFPAEVMEELEQLGSHQNAKIRRRVYSSLNVMSKGNEQRVLDLFGRFLKLEKNRKNVAQLRGAILRYQNLLSY